MQLNSIDSNEIGAIKIGMLPNSETVEVLAEFWTSIAPFPRSRSRFQVPRVENFVRAMESMLELSLAPQVSLLAQLIRGSALG